MRAGGLHADGEPGPWYVASVVLVTHVVCVAYAVLGFRPGVAGQEEQRRSGAGGRKEECLG